MKKNDLVMYAGGGSVGLPTGQVGTIRSIEGANANVCFDGEKPDETWLVPLTDLQPVADMEHDPVNNPKHYKSHPSGVECIEITRHMTFNVGNAVKYLWRADHKAATIEDLEKAEWYIRDEIERLKKLEGV